MKYEYRIVLIEGIMNRDTDILNEAGQTGWEAFAVFNGRVWMKRPLPLEQKSADVGERMIGTKTISISGDAKPQKGNRR